MRDVRGDGLNRRQCGGIGRAFLFFVPFADDACGGGFAATVFDDFRGRSERAEVGILGEFFDRCGVGCDVLAEVEAGNLEAVEEQASTARVDGVGGDALQDFADGELDGGAVFG
jgi:hypothetical protein